MDKYDGLEKRFRNRDTVLKVLAESDVPVEGEHLYPAWNSLNEDIERYTERVFLAEGGEKCIEIAFDNVAQRKVAMAWPRRKEGADKERFVKEARVTALLEHPNIMPVYDIGIEEGEPYFTMELIKGENFGQKRGKGALERSELEDFVVIFIRVCEAVAYAHSKGIAHLDIKPDNIQTGPFGEVLLCDWGLARVLDDDDLPASMDTELTAELTLCGKLRGTPGFMSPSLANGQQGVPDDDIYALGATLFFLLCGERPHESKTVEQMLKLTREKEVQSPSVLQPEYNLPAGLEAIALKALSKTERYTGVDNLIEDLRKYLRGYATEAENAGFGTLVQLLYKRQKSLCNFFLFGFILIVSLTLFFINSLNQERYKEAVARTAAENSQRIAEQERLKAEEARIEAERSLGLYEEELRFNQRLNEGIDAYLRRITTKLKNGINEKDIEKLLVDVGRNNLDAKAFEATVAVLESLIQQTEGSIRFDALRDLMFTKVILQDFKGALVLLKGFSEKELQVAEIYEFIPICEKFRKKIRKGKGLSQDDFIEFLGQISLDRFWFFNHLFNYHLVKCKNDTERLVLMGVVLDWWNSCRGINAVVTEADALRTVSFTNSELVKTLPIYIVNIIKALKIDQLDLKDCSILYTEELKKSNSVLIDVAKAKAKTLNPFFGYKGLDISEETKKSFYRKGIGLKKSGLRYIKLD